MLCFFFIFKFLMVSVDILVASRQCENGLTSKHLLVFEYNRDSILFPLLSCIQTEWIQNFRKTQNLATVPGIRLSNLHQHILCTSKPKVQQYKKKRIVLCNIQQIHKGLYISICILLSKNAWFCNIHSAPEFHYNRFLRNVHCDLCINDVQHILLDA